jgi:chromate transporter
MPSTPPLHRLFLIFLKIGATAFGGFMALVAVVQKQLVVKSKLLDDEAVVEGITLASLLPGPLAVNVITYLGYRMRGWKGALVSMAAVTLPSFLLLLLLSWVYFKYQELPSVDRIFGGILPAVTAIIISVSIGMIRKHVKDVFQYVLLAAGGAAVFFIGGFLTTIIAMVAGGLAGFFFYRKTENIDPEAQKLEKGWLKTEFRKIRTALLAIAAIAIALLALWLLRHSMPDWLFRNIQLFFTFGGMSVTLFGGGFVMIPVMQEVIVDQFGWLTLTEFADGIALGQVTPGPIMITATFVGYKVAGIPGAIVATIGMFLPPGLLMVVFTRYFLRVKDSPALQRAFRGIRPVVAGMILAAAFTIGLSITPTLFAGAVFLSVLIASLFLKVDVLYLIPAAGLLGWLVL